MFKFWINILSLLVICNSSGYAQEKKKYWVSFKDKSCLKHHNLVSKATLSNRRRLQLPTLQKSDMPIQKIYLDSIRNMGVKVHHLSKWLNAASVSLDEVAMQRLQALGFVNDITPVSTNIRVLSTHDGDNEMYTAVMDQINAKVMRKAGLDGSNVTIGIIDVGFFGAKINGSLKSLFKNDKVLGFKDYIDVENENPFGNLQPFSNAHGTTVWKLVGGMNATTNITHGLATNASYYLARTDNTRSEIRIEEDYWIAAIEWMDSLGVKLVNTSLGYSLGFDDPKENYSPEDMDGHTAKISKAAQIATQEKGMLIVVAAGNEGNDANWQIVSAPADAKGVLSVGATGIKSAAKTRYSSIGPDFLPYLKPNVACYSSSGTSFSAPVITGLAACIMQLDSSLSNYEIKTIIEQSSNLYPYGNNYIGYGIPDAAKIIALVKDKSFIPNNNKLLVTDQLVAKISIDSSIEGRIVLFHKKNETIVARQEEVLHQGNILIIQKPEDVKFTTVVLQKRVIEIEWK